MDSVAHWLDSLPFPVMEGDSQVLQNIGKWAYKIYDERGGIQMYLHLLLAALFPIYIGSHASIRCPPSAAEPVKETAAIANTLDDDDDDELDEAESSVEGLTPSDAIMFPVLASITLAGLYFLIKWLNDPTLLNKILGYYFSLIGIFGVGKLAGDALNVATTIVFPSLWSTGKEVYVIDPLLCEQVTKEPLLEGGTGELLPGKFIERKTPFPGVLSKLSISADVNHRLWTTRALFTDHWIFRGHIHGITKFKSRVRLNDVIGFLIGVIAILVYNTSGKVWWLANLMGFGFCYGTLQLMSPTTFWTGSLVLGGLFIYDIVMVFYTPLMVTVATQLDVPIKLVFPGPKRGGMLGLGDIVLPGIVMALALRFDLYLHYLRKPSPATKSKPVYTTATGRWGERFWTRSLPTNLLPSNVAGAIFPKVYFYASMIGYIFGMLTTLAVLSIFHHAQPALLYLVPGVLGSLWGTALFRGELKLMWNYTEAREGVEVEEEEMTTKDLATADGKETTIVDAKSERERGIPADEKIESVQKEAGAKKENQKTSEHAHHVFLFSLSSPRTKSKGIS